MGASNLHCNESERAFVGCVVAGEGEALDTCHASAEHFLDPLTRTVFEIAAELHATKKPVSVGSVIQRLGPARLEELGGVHQVRDICNFPVPDHAPHYFEILDHKLTLRRARIFGAWVQMEAESSGDAPAFASELRKKAAAIECVADDTSILQSALDGLQAKLARIARGERQSGIKSCVGAWNRLFGGLMDGQMYGIASRPGKGKTALMENMMADYMAAGHAVTCFERDMSPQKLIERMACRCAKVPYWVLSREYLDAGQTAKLRDAADLMREMPLHLHNPAGLTPERMCAIARKDIALHGSKAVFLDHIQTFGSGEDLREKLTSASILIRNNVTVTGISHYILAHINRKGAKGRPTPEDIKEFDQLFGDSDAMLLLWSEHEDREADAPLAGTEFPRIMFYAAKNRDGATGEDKMLFEGQHMNFLEEADIK